MNQGDWLFTCLERHTEIKLSSRGTSLCVYVQSEPHNTDNYWRVEILFLSSLFACFCFCFAQPTFVIYGKSQIFPIHAGNGVCAVCCAESAPSLGCIPCFLLMMTGSPQACTCPHLERPDWFPQTWSSALSLNRFQMRVEPRMDVNLLELSHELKRRCGIFIYQSFCCLSLRSLYLFLFKFQHWCHVIVFKMLVFIFILDTKCFGYRWVLSFVIYLFIFFTKRVTC